LIIIKITLWIAACHGGDDRSLSGAKLLRKHIRSRYHKGLLRQMLLSGAMLTDQIGTQRPSLTTVNSINIATYSSLFPRFNTAHFSRYA
jgi:hypothetical protein